MCILSFGMTNALIYFSANLTLRNALDTEVQNFRSVDFGGNWLESAVGIVYAAIQYCPYNIRHLF